MALTRRNLLYLFGVDVVLFFLANVTSGSNSKHPGTVSNIFWYAFLIGVLALILLGLITLARHLRPRATSG
jgi:low temperature requirement protein LtrA